MPRTLFSRLTSAAIIGVASAPAFFLTACATADAGVANPEAGLLDPATQKPGLAVGEHAPEGTLRDPNSNTVQVADLYADQPAVLIFYRGGWCPFCNRDLQDWQDALPEFNDAGARVVAVSMESAENALETANNNELDYDVFVDETGDVVRAFRLGFQLDQDTQTRYKGYGIDLATHNTNGAWELPAPAVYVIDRHGIIRYASADWDYSKRAGYADALAAVRNLN